MTTWPEVVMDDLELGDYIRVVDDTGLMEGRLVKIDWYAGTIFMRCPTGIPCGIGAEMTVLMPDICMRDVRGMWRRRADCEGK